jgi:hypothetical protein
MFIAKFPGNGLVMARDASAQTQRSSDAKPNVPAACGHQKHEIENCVFFLAFKTSAERAN